MKTVPKRVWQQALDKWAERAVTGEEPTEGAEDCSYCDEYGCPLCPLSSGICGHLYVEWFNAQTAKARRKYADQILMAIIERRWYEEERT